MFCCTRDKVLVPCVIATWVIVGTLGIVCTGVGGAMWHGLVVYNVTDPLIPELNITGPVLADVLGFGGCGLIGLWVALLRVMPFWMNCRCLLSDDLCRKACCISSAVAVGTCCAAVTSFFFWWFIVTEGLVAVLTSIIIAIAAFFTGLSLVLTANRWASGCFECCCLEREPIRVQVTEGGDGQYGATDRTAV